MTLAYTRSVTDDIHTLVRFNREIIGVTPVGTMYVELQTSKCTLAICGHAVDAYNTGRPRRRLIAR
jgi:hypothetical protein